MSSTPQSPSTQLNGWSPLRWECQWVLYGTVLLAAYLLIDQHSFLVGGYPAKLAVDFELYSYQGPAWSKHPSTVLVKVPDSGVGTSLSLQHTAWLPFCPRANKHVFVLFWSNDLYPFQCYDTVMRFSTFQKYLHKWNKVAGKEMHPLYPPSKLWKQSLPVKQELLLLPPFSGLKL